MSHPVHFRLLIIGLVTDGDAITPEVIQEVGEVKLLVNGLVIWSHVSTLSTQVRIVDICPL